MGDPRGIRTAKLKFQLPILLLCLFWGLGITPPEGRETQVSRALRSQKRTQRAAVGLGRKGASASHSSRVNRAGLSTKAHQGPAPQAGRKGVSLGGHRIGHHWGWTERERSFRIALPACRRRHPVSLDACPSRGAFSRRPRPVRHCAGWSSPFVRRAW